MRSKHACLGASLAILAIAIGSVIPLVMFLAWNAMILGSVTSVMMQGVSDGSTVFDSLQVLQNGQAGPMAENFGCIRCNLIQYC